MNRREALQRAAWLMGGTLSAPILLGIPDGWSAEETKDWKPEFLTRPQIDIVTTVVDIMIPRTATPGAKDVGVPALIDTMLAHCYSALDRERFATGITEFDAAARSAYSKPFVEVDRIQQSILVHKFHDSAVADERHLNKPEGAAVPRPFILMTKELALVGFFTSFPGSTQVLQYEAIPGAWHACLPLSEAGNGKTWATEPGLRL